jgi:hypothetical protein
MDKEVYMIDRLAISLWTSLFLLSSWCAAAHAGTQTVDLVRSTLQNVPDAAGTYQYEGGTLENTSGSQLGTYEIVRRTGSGTSTYNTALTTITLFLPPAATGQAPNVIIIQGAWSFNSGDFLGSVAVASNPFHWLIGSDAASTIPSGSTSKLVLTWVGSNQLKF